MKRRLMKKNYMSLCRKHKSARLEFGTRLYIIRHIMAKLLDFEPIN
jgi:hypothetical protein